MREKLNGYDGDDARGLRWVVTAARELMLLEYSRLGRLSCGPRYVIDPPLVSRRVRVYIHDFIRIRRRCTRIAAWTSHTCTCMFFYLLGASHAKLSLRDVHIYDS